MIKEIFDFTYIFTSEKTRKSLFLFMFTMLVYSLNILPADLPLLIVLGFCTFCSLELTFFLFTFYSLFEGVATFSFGLTLNVILQLVILTRVVAFIVRHPILIRQSLAKIRLAYGLYWLVYGIMALLLWGSLTGLALFFRMIMVLLVVWFVQVKNQPYIFWKALFHILFLSVLLSVVYGIFNDTALDRDVTGLAGVSVIQLYGSLGTTRLGLFLVIALNFPLYFVKNRILKACLILLLVTLTFLTVSITAIIMLVLAFCIYLISLRQIKKVIVYFFASFVFLIGTYNLWSKISFVEPVVTRVSVILDFASVGNINRSTSGREELSESYMIEYNRRSEMEKFFGVFNPENFDESIEKFSHNTYIDMLTYNGLLGIFILMVYCVFNLSYYRKTKLFFPILSMKLILLISAYTVSILTAAYWTWFVFI